MGGGGLALYLVVWLAMCLLKIAIFEVYASLKWNLGNQNLSQALVLQKRENLTACQSLHYMLIISFCDRRNTVTFFVISGQQIVIC